MNIPAQGELRPVAYDASTPTPMLTTSIERDNFVTKFRLDLSYIGGLMSEAITDPAAITETTIHFTDETVGSADKPLYGSYNFETKTITINLGSIAISYQQGLLENRRAFNDPYIRLLYFNNQVGGVIFHELGHRIDDILLGSEAIHAERLAYLQSVWQQMHPDMPADELPTLPSKEEISKDRKLLKSLYDRSPEEVRARQYADDQIGRIAATARPPLWPTRIETVDMYVPYFSNTAWAVKCGVAWLAQKVGPAKNG